MKLKLFLPLILILINLCSIQCLSQERNTFINESQYDYQEAFSRRFYSIPGNQYRTAGGQPGFAYWQNRTDYKISVWLNETTDEIKGTAMLSYTNNSPDALQFLWIYLEQNLFSKSSVANSILLKEGSADDTNESEFEGGVKIKSVKIIPAKDGKIQLPVKYIITDTRMQVWLPTALAPETGKVRLLIEYAYTCPANGANRTGIQSTKNGKIYSIAQWYPRMCVYDDLNGWNTIPYTGIGEFYSDYGNFDITINAPVSHVVLCSGELLNPTEVYSTEQIKRWGQAKVSDTTVIIRSKEEVERINTNSPFGYRAWYFRIKNARDAVWASSPAFIIAAARINLPSGKKSLFISAYPVESDSAAGWIRSTEYGKTAIENYSEKWFEYPYPTAISIASNIGGMEYPGMVFCDWKRKGRGLWNVIDHELGHTWFPIIVGSNERRHGWMDEGFDVFINGLSSAEFNEGEYKGRHLDMHLESAIFTNQKLEPIMTAPDNIKKENLATLLYFKPAAGLNLLRNQVLGKERFDVAFRTYIQRWAYKHPSPDDFFRTMENVSGEDLSWFWQGWFLYNWQLDQAIREVRYVNDNPSEGVLITIDNLKKMPMPVELELITKSGKITFFKLPIAIWERSSYFTFKAPVTEELQSVVLDPNKDLPDSNTSNNSWTNRNK